MRGQMLSFFLTTCWMSQQLEDEWLPQQRRKSRCQAYIYVLLYYLFIYWEPSVIFLFDHFYFEVLCQCASGSIYFDRLRPEVRPPRSILQPPNLTIQLCAVFHLVEASSRRRRLRRVRISKPNPASSRTALPSLPSLPLFLSPHPFCFFPNLEEFCASAGRVLVSAKFQREKKKKKSSVRPGAGGP